MVTQGLSTSWYIHGLIASTIREHDADYIDILYDNGTNKRMYSPKVLYRMKPNSVSIEDHNKWFSGCGYELT